MTNNSNFNVAQLIIFASDGLSFAAAIIFSSLLRLALNPALNNQFAFNLKEFGWLMLFNVFITVIVFTLSGLYSEINLPPVIELKNVTIALVTVFGISYFFISFARIDQIFSRVILLLNLILSLGIYPFSRIMAHKIIKKNKLNEVPAIIISKLSFLNQALKIVNGDSFLGLSPNVLLLVDELPDPIINFENQKVEMYSNQTLMKYRGQGISILCVFFDDDIYLNEDYFRLFDNFRDLFIFLPPMGVGSLWTTTLEAGNQLLLHNNYSLLNNNYLIIKEIIDKLLALFMALFFSPLIILIAILLFMEDQGGVIYSQLRLGQNGKIIQIFKFRSMVKNADLVLENHLSSNTFQRLEYEKYRKLNNDPRVTKIGRLIRKFSLDELPQLYNVLRGDLSFVGPRAYLITEHEHIEENFEVIKRVKPGLTGWWQINGRNEKTFHQRQLLDIYYIRNWSLWLDYYILLKTVWTVLSGSGK